MIEKTSASEDTWRLGEDTVIPEDPLLDCLIQLSKIYDRPASRTALITGLPLVDNRLSVELFSRAADRASLASRILKKPIDKLHNLQLPVILLLNDKQACVLIEKKTNGELRVLLPETGMGEKIVSKEELENMYSGYAFFVRPKFRVERKPLDSASDSKKHWFWGTIFESWRIYRDVIAASFLINVFGLITPFFVLIVYDRVIPNGAFETLWVLALGVSIIYLFAVMMRFLRGYFVDEAAKIANLKLSSNIFQKVMNLRLEARPQSIGSFSKNLQEFETIRDFITSFTITAIIDMPFTILALLVVWYIGGSIVICHIVAILLLLIYAYFIQIPLRKTVEKTFSASAQKNAILVEGLSGLEAIKMLGAESQIQRAWEEAVSYIARWSAKSRLFSSSAGNFLFLIQSLVVVVVVIAGVYMVTKAKLTQGGLIALVIVTRQVIAPLGQVVNLAIRYHNAKQALKTLNDIMALPVERPTDKSFLLRTRFEGAVGVKNLIFAYPGQTVNTLNNISLEISAGEKIGIIGPVGSGKTTLGKLMLGLYQPSGGMVSMDGTDIRQIDPAQLRRYIGYVPQDIMLFRGTVGGNITMGVHDVDDYAIARAAKTAGVIDFVSKHPMGFDMEVGEQGRGLSGGQRQCIVLARALLLDPPVLVLDEPTSNMDNRTEVRLKNNLTDIIKGKTLILITHRASLLELVDRLIVLDNGNVIADGPKASVLEAMKQGQIKF
ncbi:MAG: type I secretion system permease/ATPase [Pseudomonadota bacterium]